MQPGCWPPIFEAESMTLERAQVLPEPDLPDALCANMSDTTLLDNLGYNREQRSVQR